MAAGVRPEDENLLLNVQWSPHVSGSSSFPLRAAQGPSSDLARKFSEQKLPEANHKSPGRSSINLVDGT